MSGRLGLAFAALFFRALEAKRRLLERGAAGASEPGRLYGFEVRTIDGRTVRLSDYRGKVLLIVNTASLCGFTPQYASLEALYRRHGDRGLRVLAFPANDFGSQEPGGDEEIREFCKTRYSVSFDLFSKISVRGPGIHPLYRFLTRESGFDGDVVWNFSKFVADREGRVVARFGPAEDPVAGPLAGKIEVLLA